jgi:hypothetical protein
MVSEVKLAKDVTEWLKEEAWDVYEEVSIGYSDSADIVATRGPVLAVIEAKQTLSLSVIGQAKRWLPHAHQVYVAVPAHKRGSSSEAARWVCDLTGLGLIYVSSHNVRVVVQPEFRRRVDDEFLRSKLRPQHQDGSVPAGSASVGRWTPWKTTVHALVAVVKASPGIPLKEALAKIHHHYRSDKGAVSSLSHYLRKGIIKDIRMEPGRGLKLFPTHIP